MMDQIRPEASSPLLGQILGEEWAINIIFQKTLDSDVTL